MDNELRTNMGFYSPSFIRMHVKTLNSLLGVGNGADERDESIYLHEFVHFIQDITTSFGYANICILADYMRDVNYHVLKNKAPGFAVPFYPPGDDPFNVADNLILKKHYVGDKLEEEAAIQTYYMFYHELEELRSPNGLHSVMLTCTGRTGKKHKIVFGGLCIMESMAHIVQTECYPGIYVKQPFTYNSAEQLAAHIYPEFATSRFNVLALCDAVLGVFNPGELFCTALEEMKEKQITFNNPQEIYAFCHIVHQLMVNPLTDIRKVLQDGALLSIRQLNAYFNDPYFDSVKLWLENMILSGLSHRKNRPGFILQLAAGGKLSENIAYRTFINEVGSPLVTNENYEVSLCASWSFRGNVNFHLIWCVDQIYKIFLGKQIKCELFQSCKKNGISVDHRCLSAPWERAGEQYEKWCTFAQLWRNWNMAGYYPVNPKCYQ